MADFTIENHGSLFLFHPVTDTARDHLREHVSGDATWFGAALVVEPRYAHDLAAQLTEDGFTVE